MSSVPSPSDKINSVAEVMPQRDGTEGTVDSSLNEAPQFYLRYRDQQHALASIYKAFHYAMPNLKPATCDRIARDMFKELRDGQPG